MRLWKTVVGMAVIALASCSSQIDSRNVDIYNGLVYKHGSEEPFSGTVIYHQTPSVVNRYFLATRGFVKYPGLTGGKNKCFVPYVKGDVEGNVYCKDAQREKTIAFTIDDGVLNGGSETFDQGHTTSRLNWKKGALEGDQKVFSPDGGVVTHEWTVEGGSKDGTEVFRTRGGDVFAEGEWKDGRFTGTFFDGKSSVYTLEDGVKNGPFKIFDGAKTDRVSIAGSYTDNLPSGRWTYRHPDGFLTHLTGGSFEGQPVPDGVLALLHMPEVAKIQTQRVKGMLEGEIRGLDEGDNVIVSFVFKDGKIRAPVSRFAPATGARQTYSDAGTLEALNYRTSRQMRLPRFADSRFGAAAGQAAMDAEQAKQRERTARVQNVVNMRPAGTGLL